MIELGATLRVANGAQARPEDQGGLGDMAEGAEFLEFFLGIGGAQDAPALPVEDAREMPQPMAKAFYDSPAGGGDLPPGGNAWPPDSVLAAPTMLPTAEPAPSAMRGDMLQPEDGARRAAPAVDLARLRWTMRFEPAGPAAPEPVLAGGPDGGGIARAPGPSAAPLATLPPVPLQAGPLSQGLGERLLWMVQNGVQVASMQIRPEHLGPMELRLRVEGEGVQLNVASPHAAVREAVEQAAPRLREMLAEQGLDLLEVDVGQHEQADAHPGQPDPGAFAERDDAAAEADGTAPEATGPAIRTGRGLVDAFA